MSGRSDVYLGAAEAQALVGAYHQAWGGPVMPRQPQWYPHHHRHHHQQYYHQQQQYYPRDHRAWMGADPAALGGGGPAPAAYLREMDPPTMANRQVLPMNTGTTPVPIASTAQITSRPQRVAFRPERVFVSASDIGGGGSAANWIVNDITIGNRSQLAQSGALPGDMFSNVAIDSFVTFETAQTAMDVVMIVTYQGATEGGTPFYGAIIGTAAV
jgi:hypothetical protein